MNSKIEKISECDGCCQRTTCNHDLEKCCYLINQKCLIRETRKYEED
ncbi:MAG: hypothetical protein K6A34_08165 [Methanobrevibacter sp.]|nr:hypothetical protein [Methanobrevibacter sp.]